MPETGQDCGSGAGCRSILFMLLRTISNFTYEMVNNQSEIAKDGDFRKHRHGCRCFRLVRLDIIAHFISEI